MLELVSESREREVNRMKKTFKTFIFILFIGVIAWLSTPFNILIMGSDAYGNHPTKGSRSDGLIVVKVTPILAKIKMVSIPRDSYVEIPCENYKTDKITHSHAYGGIQCTVETVENLLDTKINYHVLFRFDDIMNITEMIGGVEVVANHSFKQDYFEQEVFRFKEGETYNLKGRMALAYVRHRKSDTTAKRDERQRQVIQSIVKKLASPSGWKYIPQVYSYTQKNMEVSFNPLRAFSFIPPVVISRTKIEQHEMKGSDKMIKGVYYFVLDENSLENTRDEFKIFF